MGRIVVLDIGGTAIKSGLIEDGVLHQRRETPSDAHLGGPHIMETAARIIQSYAGYSRIGISTASQVDSVQGVIRYANSNIPNYTGIRVRQQLEAAFGVPVAVENDVNSAALGEALFGAGKQAENGDFLCLTYGTGIGGAIVMGGQIYKGATFSAGEVGHIITHAGERDADGGWQGQGFYEKYASTTALVRSVQAVDPTLDNGRKIFGRLDDPGVKAAVDRWIDEVIYGLASLVHTFNPSLVVVGGGIMREEYIIHSLRQRIAGYIMPSFGGLRIMPAELGNDAGLLGVGHLAAAIG